MAAPRPLGAAVSADVEIIDDEYDEYGEYDEDTEETEETEKTEKTGIQDAPQTELGLRAKDLVPHPPRPPSYPQVSDLPRSSGSSTTEARKLDRLHQVPARIARRLWQHGVDDPVH